MAAISTEDTCAAFDDALTHAQGRVQAYTSALCIIPPEDVWDHIQTIRVKHDSGFIRWQPHFNFLFPFVLDDEEGRHFDAAAARLEPVLSALEPFDVTIGPEQLAYFLQSKRSVVWAGPDDAGLASMHKVFQAIVPLFPECPPQRDSFVPHMSLGQWSKKQAEPTRIQLGEDWKTITFRVDSLQLISRKNDEPFHIRRSVALGGAKRS